MSREGELLMVKRDEEVIKQILEYVLDKRYCQAILIDGEWGTGKTFFVKDKLLNRLRETVPQKIYIMFHCMVYHLLSKLWMKFILRW